MSFIIIIIIFFPQNNDNDDGDYGDTRPHTHAKLKKKHIWNIYEYAKHTHTHKKTFVREAKKHYVIITKKKKNNNN